jgi:cytochrome c5
MIAEHADIAVWRTDFKNSNEGTMSDAHNDHQSVIRTPKQLIAAIVAAFVIPILIIVLLVKYVSTEHQVGAGSDNQTAAAIAARLQPVSDQGFALKDVNAVKVLQAGGDVYKAVCSACHATGAIGAPKPGDAAAWSARIAQGYDTLVAHAIQGIRGMPAKGGNADLDDIEVASAVVFMANQSGAKFKEPAMPAPAAATAPAGAAPAAPAGAAPAAASATAPAPAAAPSAAAPTGVSVSK